MADGSSHRTVTVERITRGAFTVTNTRGSQLRFGMGSDTDFTPTELLLAAFTGCTAIDVDILTSRRAEPETFHVQADADKVRDARGNRLTGIVVTFQIAFPVGADGDQAPATLPDAVNKSHDRLCTVYLDNLDRHLPHSGLFRARNFWPQSRIPGVSRGSAESAPTSSTLSG